MACHGGAALPGGSLCARSPGPVVPRGQSGPRPAPRTVPATEGWMDAGRKATPVSRAGPPDLVPVQLPAHSRGPGLCLLGAPWGLGVWEAGRPWLNPAQLSAGPWWFGQVAGSCPPRSPASASAPRGPPGTLCPPLCRRPQGKAYRSTWSQGRPPLPGKPHPGGPGPAPQARGSASVPYLLLRTPSHGPAGCPDLPSHLLELGPPPPGHPPPPLAVPAGGRRAPGPP